MNRYKISETPHKKTKSSNPLKKSFRFKNVSFNFQHILDELLDDAPYYRVIDSYFIYCHECDEYDVAFTKEKDNKVTYHCPLCGKSIRTLYDDKTIYYQIHSELIKEKEDKISYHCYGYIHLLTYSDSTKGKNIVQKHIPTSYVITYNKNSKMMYLTKLGKHSKVRNITYGCPPSIRHANDHLEIIEKRPMIQLFKEKLFDDKWDNRFEYPTILQSGRFLRFPNLQFACPSYFTTFFTPSIYDDGFLKQLKNMEFGINGLLEALTGYTPTRPIRRILHEKPQSIILYQLVCSLFTSEDRRLKLFRYLSSHLAIHELDLLKADLYMHTHQKNPINRLYSTIGSVFMSIMDNLREIRERNNLHKIIYEGTFYNEFVEEIEKASASVAIAPDTLFVSTNESNLYNDMFHLLTVIQAMQDYLSLTSDTCQTYDVLEKIHLESDDSGEPFKINNYSENRKIKKKIERIHNNLARQFREHESRNEDIPLEPVLFEKFENQQVGEYTLHLAQDTNQLRVIGSVLDNCVFMYKNALAKRKENHKFIVYAEKENTIHYCSTLSLADDENSPYQYKCTEFKGKENYYLSELDTPENINAFQSFFKNEGILDVNNEMETIRKKTV